MNTDNLAKAFNFIHVAYPHLLDNFIKRVGDGDSPADALLHLLSEDLARKSKCAPPLQSYSLFKGDDL